MFCEIKTIVFKIKTWVIDCCVVLKVFNMVTNSNNAKTLIKYISYDCKCKLNSATWNSNGNSNNNNNNNNNSNNNNNN